jgi:hypothetical protein
MNRFAMSIAFSMGGLALASAQAPDLAKDERLAKPVTVHVKMVPLPEAMTALTKASGVTVESATSLKDLKVTILVKDQPAHLVLAKVASTLDLEWEADGATYRIKSNADVAASERRYADQEERLRRKETEERLTKLSAVAAVPYATAKERDAQLTPERYLLGQLLRGLGGAQLNAFWAGQTIRTSAPLQEETAEADTNAQRRRGRGDRPRVRLVRVAAQYDPVAGRLVTSYEPSVTAGAARLIDRPYPEGELAATPFGKRVGEWERRDDRSESLKKTFAPANPASAGWFGNRLSAADALEAFHLASGVPVVADAFRVPVAPDRSGGTALTWLDRFRQMNRAFVRTEDGFAMVRHGGFWRLRRLETPERIVRPLEAAKAVALEDYATFAASLNPTQALTYGLSGAVLLRVDPEPLRNGMPALRFYASLGSLQRQARMNRAIPFGTLGAQQRTLFLEALDGTLEGGVPVGRGNGIDVANEANQLAFLMTLRTVEGGEPRAARTGTSLLFGTGANDGVGYALPVAPRP